MKIVLITPTEALDGSSVRSVGVQAGFNVTDVRTLVGPEPRLAVEYDEQSEVRPRKSALIDIAKQYGLSLDKANVAITPRWAAAVTTAR